MTSLVCRASVRIRTLAGDGRWRVQFVIDDFIQSVLPSFCCCLLWQPCPITMKVATVVATVNEQLLIFITIYTSVGPGITYRDPEDPPVAWVHPSFLM